MEGETPTVSRDRLIYKRTSANAALKDSGKLLS